MYDIVTSSVPRIKCNSCKVIETDWCELFGIGFVLSLLIRCDSFLFIVVFLFYFLFIRSCFECVYCVLIAGNVERSARAATSFVVCL